MSSLPLNVSKIRRDFPILSSGKIYLDSAASSLTPEPVIRKVLEFYREYRANVGRGVYSWSAEATDEYERARKEVAKLINAKDASEIIFTKNTTEGINTVAHGLEWKSGDKIVTTIVEHHSNFIPWLRITKKLGLKIEIVKSDGAGRFEITDFEKAIDERTKLVAISHASNVLGTVLPVKEVTKIAHERGAKILIDGAQSVPHMPVDVSEIGCDFLAFSGHKMLAPTGIGVLYVNSDSSDVLEPLAVGGGTVDHVSISDFSLTRSPDRFEAGTPPIAQAIGLGEAVKYLRRLDMEDIAVHERKLTEKIISGLSEIEDTEIYGPLTCDDRIGIVAFNVRDLDPNGVAEILDEKGGIMVRSGHHCAMPLHVELLRRPLGSVRASVYIYNTAREIDKLIEMIERIAKMKS